jgi:predicted amidophosphoribosyltransferase
VLDLLLPPACLVCRTATRSGERLCRGCRAALPWLPPDRCVRCGLPAPCGVRCPARAAAFERSWAPVAYDGAARALVHALKLHGMTAAADVMASQIVAVAPPELLAEGVLVPVPGNPGRRRGRGFDPAEAIARALCRRSGLPMQLLLQAHGRGPAQAGAARATRLRRAESAAVVVRARAPEHVVLVDDVHTTGATLDACARALRAAGASSVTAVIYARTLG